MPRKLRREKVRLAALPSPAWTYALLAGRDPDCRLHGWVTQAQAGQYGEPTADDIWAQHQEALTDEARAHGFEPFWQTKRRTTGDGFERWSAQFLQQHTY
jgi:hypothetical protein